MASNFKLCFVAAESIFDIYSFQNLRFDNSIFTSPPPPQMMTYGMYAFVSCVSSLFNDRIKGNIFYIPVPRVPIVKLLVLSLVFLHT